MERRFFADAEHELLTPIAALRAQLHLLVTAPDADAKACARVDVDGGLQRIASLIRQLLSIARVSSKEMRLNLQPQDLVVLVQERLGLAAPRALDKGIDIALHAPRSQRETIQPSYSTWNCPTGSAMTCSPGYAVAMISRQCCS